MNENQDSVNEGQTAAVKESGCENGFSGTDIAENRTMAGLSYLLFFLPLVSCPQSQYARFHANQSLVLLLLAVIGNVVLGIIPLVGWVLLPLFDVFILILEISGMINGFGGKAKQLPLIGKINILK